MYYSGEKSKEFWNRINSIENKEKRDLLYSLGYMLQSIEYHVLSILEIKDKKENIEQYYCFFDVDDLDEYCTMDKKYKGPAEDCIHASIFKAQNKTKFNCPYWRRKSDPERPATD